MEQAFYISMRGWPLESNPRAGRDEEIDRAVFTADEIMSSAVEECTEIRIAYPKLRGNLSFDVGGPLPPSTARWSKKYGDVYVQVHCDLLRLRKLPIEDVPRDIALAFLAALRDYCKRRKVDVTKLEAAMDQLGPPPAGSGFLNPNEKVPRKREKVEQLDMLVVLRVPLQATMPSRAELKTLQKLDDVIHAAVTRGKVGELDAREVGGGVAEYFIVCKRSSPVVDVLKALYKKGKLPSDCRMAVINMKTDSETSRSLRS